MTTYGSRAFGHAPVHLLGTLGRTVLNAAHTLYLLLDSPSKTLLHLVLLAHRASLRLLTVNGLHTSFIHRTTAVEKINEQQIQLNKRTNNTNAHQRIYALLTYLLWHYPIIHIAQFRKKNFKTVNITFLFE